MPQIPILNRSLISEKKYPTKIIQFGDGNFLRAFLDLMVHEMNQKIQFNAGIVAVKSRPGTGLIPIWKEQQGLFTVLLNGIKDNAVVSSKHLVDCVNDVLNPYDDFESYMNQVNNPDLRFVFSNTTESGIVYDETDSLSDKPQKSFPGKLTALLYKRFQVFGGASDKGLIVIPCELIKDNGKQLKYIVLKHAKAWGLEKDFIAWIEEDTVFCNTLVDRIVPGFPKIDEQDLANSLGYVDKLAVEAELFHLLVIEAPVSVRDEFPANKANLNVVFANNLTPFRTQKVRILNGAHTCMVPVGYLYGLEMVRESVEDLVVGQYLKELIFEEICPTLESSETNIEEFAKDVLDRFRNPHIANALLSISLNSVSKFKTRVLPSLLDYVNVKHELPKRIVFAFAALICFYSGKRDEEEIVLNDDAQVLDFFKKEWKKFSNSRNDLRELISIVLSKIDFWDKDLSKIEGLLDLLVAYAHNIKKNGVRQACCDFRELD